MQVLVDIITRAFKITLNKELGTTNESKDQV